MRERAKRIAILLIYALFIIFILAINFLTPLMGEDYALLSFYPSENVNFGIVLFRKMAFRIWLQMANWNVRIGEQLSIVFGCFDKSIFNVFNTLITVYFAHIVKKFAFKDSLSFKKSILSDIFIFSLLITFQPVLGEIFFWRTGSTNYLWALCILLSFILPIRYYVGASRIDIIGKSITKTILLTFLGFFAGLTNENTVVTFWAFYVGVIIYDIIRKRSTPKWIYLTFSSFTISMIYMLEAPSTKNRISYYNTAYGITKLTVADYFRRAVNVVIDFFSTNYFYVIITLCTITIAYILNRKKGKISNIEFFETFGFLLLSSLSCGALIFSPYVETRAFLLVDFMMLVNILYYAYFIFENININKLFILSFVVAAFFITSFQANKIMKVYKQYSDFCVSRESEISCSDNDVFLWGSYIGERNTRELTTREDYLLGNKEYLEKYYNKSIVMINGSIWDKSLKTYINEEITGKIETFDLNLEDMSLSISGWSAFKNRSNDYKDCQILISIDDYTNLYFLASRYKRTDIGLKDNNAGFYANISLPDEIDVGEIKVYLVDTKRKMLGQLLNKG